VELWYPKAKTSKYQKPEQILRVWELLEKIMFQHPPAKDAKIKKGKIRELCFDRFWRDSKLSELDFPSLAFPCIVLHCIRSSYLVLFCFHSNPIQFNPDEARPSQAKSSQAKSSHFTFLFFSFNHILKSSE
jgi:hypothetical protein